MLTGRRAFAFLATALAGLLVSTFILADSEKERFFSYGKKPSTGVIEVQIVPVMPPTRTAYTLFGDGRVEIRTRSTVGDERETEFLQWKLEPTELAAIVDQAVAAGLLDFSPADRLKQLQSQAIKNQELPAPPVMDGVTVLFRITLDDYAEGGEPSTGPLQREFSISNPRDFARRFKDDKELAFMDQLLVRLNDIHKQARRAARP